MYIPQKQMENLQKIIQSGKAVVLYGARRVGKTTLIRQFMQNLRDRKSEDILLVNGDDIVQRQFLQSQSITKLKDFIGANKILIIDEAQYIEKVGLNIKLMIDHIPDLKIIATGSSSFELARDIGDPLTGRKHILHLFPLAQMEISLTENLSETAANLESRLIYGSYPEIVTMKGNKNKQEYLREIISSYLFKDILALEGIRHSDKLVRLLQLIAFQIGGEVSLNELGAQIGMSKNTVDKYLDLLEKVFVIYKRGGFSRNLRKEITKNYRYYFHDNGIRNALVGNFNPINIRNDLGQLWENYIVTERHKRNAYLREMTDSYFWRTYDKKEIDLVEAKKGRFFGYEIKWQKKRATPPSEWKTSYKGAGFQIIHKENYLKFIK
ncbi:ATP-binding protein [Candidatus Sumerlaeota bacterium]|nr:ATP-binding protein [Candidatus Sumerlaeota bacterium]